MIAVIFEVWPKPEYREAYLQLAGEMRAMVDEIDGFISVERFQSLVDDGKLLSLSFWRDEAALDEWRKLAAHRRAQDIGRKVHFTDYRLRVVGTLRDYGMTDRAQAPADSRELHG